MTKQKEEISNIIKEYDAFIRKLISDKKNLSENCQKYCGNYEKTVQDFTNYKEKTMGLFSKAPHEESFEQNGFLFFENN